MLFASQILLRRWDFMAEEERPRTTDERKNYVEGNFSIDGSSLKSFFLWVKRNSKTVERIITWSLVVVSVFGGVSVRNLQNLTVVNKNDVEQLKADNADKTQKYEAMQKEVAMCKEAQAKQLEFYPLVERLTNLLKRNHPIFRNPGAQREFNEVTTKILQIKPISQGESVAGSSMFGGAR